MNTKICKISSFNLPPNFLVTIYTLYILRVVNGLIEIIFFPQKMMESLSLGKKIICFEIQVFHLISNLLEQIILASRGTTVFQNPCPRVKVGYVCSFCQFQGTRNFLHSMEFLQRSSAY